MIILIDTSNLLYFCLRRCNENSLFESIIAQIRQKFDGSLLFVLDSYPMHKKKINANYKANRKKKDKAFMQRFNVMKQEVIQTYKTVHKEGFEADDLIASIIHQNNFEFTIVSLDKDFMQLLSPKTALYDFKNQQIINETHCYNKYGITPSQFVEYQMLVGDTIDNVEGVKGIGKNGAKKLLNRFGNIKNIYQNLHLIGNVKHQNALKMYEKNLNSSKKLLTLANDIDISCPLV